MDVVGSDPALLEPQLLQTAHIASGLVLDLLDGLAGGEQTVRRARVQPGEPLLQGDDLELPPAEASAQQTLTPPANKAAAKKSIDITVDDDD